MLQRCVSLSNAIYGELSHLGQNIPGDCKLIKTWSTALDMQSVFLQTPRAHILVFRGSESWMDWICDMLICQVKLRSNVYIHRGFYNQLYSNGILDEIIETVGLHCTTNSEAIWVTGHSLGGALASLCGYELSLRGYTIRVVSFGSPRVGNIGWQLAFNAQLSLKSLRVTTPRDPVSASPLLNYLHVGSSLTVYAPSTDNLLEQNHAILLETPPSRWNDNIFLKWNPFDHSCQRYEAYCSGLVLDDFWSNTYPLEPARTNT